MKLLQLALYNTLEDVIKIAYSYVAPQWSYLQLLGSHISARPIKSSLKGL